MGPVGVLGWIWRKLWWQRGQEFKGAAESDVGREWKSLSCSYSSFTNLVVSFAFLFGEACNALPQVTCLFMIG